MSQKFGRLALHMWTIDTTLLAIALDAALGNPDRAVARLTHLVEQVRHEEERLPAVAESRHAHEAVAARSPVEEICRRDIAG